MGNKCAKYATNATVAAFILNVLAGLASFFGILSFIASIVAIGLAIKGIINYYQDKSIGGLGWCILAILISIWMFVVSIIRIIQTLFFYF